MKAAAHKASPKTPARLSRGKRWAFRLGVLLGMPLLLLGGLEITLRLLGYGYPTTFFLSRTVEGKAWLTENDRFGWQFFPPELARNPPPTLMRPTKPPGTIRIFLLGESAAMGDPRPAYGMGRYLQTLLRERYPAGEFEVVTVAMTAINSHAILPIARECARHDGDFWVVYAGNNEMVGPFGAVGVLGPAAPSWRQVRWRLALEQTRLGQWLTAQSWRLRGGGARGWTGMALFSRSALAADDPARGRVHRNFACNLDDLLAVARRAGVKVVLSTVAVNLADCPPFVSLGSPDLAAEAQAERTRLLAEGEEADRDGDAERARAAFEQAVALDPAFAWSHFALGRHWLDHGDPVAARASLEPARDLDALPFRTDSTLNRLIREAGSKRSEDSVRLVNAEDALAPLGEPLPGARAFYEHVHLTPEANYLLALAFAKTLAPWLPEKVTRNARSEWASEKVCDGRLGLTAWNRAAILEDMLQRLKQPPFTAQTNHAAHLERLRAEWRGLRQGMTTNAAVAAHALYEDAIRRWPDDHRLHENCAEFLEAVGDFADATEQWKRVAQLTPWHHVGWFHYGRLLAQQGHWTDAEAAFRQAAARRPELSETWLQLGKIKLALDQPAEALPPLERARDLQPRDWRIHHQLGRAFSRLKRPTEALASLREAVRLEPDAVEARYHLGEELAFAGQNEAARKEFEAVLRRQPDHLAARLNLGVALVQQKQLAAAAEAFREVLRRDPDNPRAQDYLRQVEAHLKQPTPP